MDTTPEHLHGTKSATAEPGQEHECIDRYIKAEALENTDYEIIGADTWEFLKDKYGCDLEVRRYYQKGQWSYYSKLEVSMKRVPLCLVFTDQLAKVEVNDETFALKLVQVRKTAKYGDLKKRIADCASNLLGKEVKQD